MELGFTNNFIERVSNLEPIFVSILVALQIVGIVLNNYTDSSSFSKTTESKSY